LLLFRASATATDKSFVNDPTLNFQPGFSPSSIICYICPPGPQGPPGPHGVQGPPGPEPSRTATLTVVKHVDNSAGGQTASDFNLHVSGNNALPTDFAGSESGTTVQMSDDPYGVSEFSPNPGRYMASYSSDCSGIITSGEAKTCTVTNHLR